MQNQFHEAVNIKRLAPANPDSKFDGYVNPGDFFIHNGVSCLRISQNFLEGKINAVDENGNLVYIEQGQNVRPGAMFSGGLAFQNELELKYYLRIDDSQVPESKTFNAVKLSTGELIHIDDDEPIATRPKRWPI